MENSKNLKLQVVFLLTSALCSPSFAQEAPSNDDEFLGTIILSSPKRNIDSQDLIASGVAVSGFDIEDQNLTDSEELFDSIPGLQMQDYGGFNAQPTALIRGIGTDRPEYENSVQINYDGLSLSDAAMANFPLFDVEQVEVLRGPQSTLYGKNALGGVVSINSRRPTDISEFSTKIGAASHGGLSFETVLSGALVEDKILSRFALQYDKTDGDVLNPATGANIDGSKSLAARWINVFEISDNLTADLQLQASSFKDNGMEAYTFRNGVPVLNSVTNPYITDIDNQSAVLTLTYDLPGSTFKSISTLSKSDSVGAGMSPFTLRGLQRNERNVDATSQEFRWASTGEQKLNWVAGLYFMDSTRNEAFDTASPTLNFDLDTTLDKQSASIFGEVTYEVSSRFRVTGGLRVARDSVKIMGDDSAVVFGVPVSGQYSGEVKDTTVSPKIGFAYDLTPDNSIYGIISHGYKAGGFNTVNTLTPAAFPGGSGPRPASDFRYERETVINYEIGSKNRFLDGRLELNSALYYQDWRDRQVLQLDALGNVSASNAEKARSFGIEADMRYGVTDRFSLSGGFAYGVSEYVDYVDNNGVQLKGKQTEFFPEFQGTLSGTYHFPGFGDRLSLTGTMRYTGKHYFDPQNTLSQNDLILIDASATYEINDDFSLNIWAKNLTNRSYVTYKFDDGFNQPNSVTGTMGDGLSAGINLVARF